MFHHESTRAETRKVGHVTFTAGARRAAANDKDECGAHGKGRTANNARHRSRRPLLAAHGKTEEGEKMSDFTYSDAVATAVEGGDTSQLKEISKRVSERIEQIKAEQRLKRAQRQADPSVRKKSMRGMGRVYLRNHVWWIAFYHRGQKIRESSKSAKESVACALLKQRLAETQTGQFVADQGKVTFDDLVEGIATDYALNNRRSFKSGAAVCIKHLREFF